MDSKFKIGKTIYLVILFVFIIGLVLGLLNSSFALTFLPKGSVLGGMENNIQVKRLSKQTLKGLKQEEYLLIYNQEDAESKNIKDNIVQTLSYMKKKVSPVSLANVPSSFNSYKNVIIAFEEVSMLPQLKSLETYTANGGKVFFAIRPELNGALQNLYRKLGIYETGEFTAPNGMKLISNVLIKQQQLTMKKDEIAQNSSITVGLDERCNVYIQSLDHIPLLWDVPYKKGKFMVFNGTMLAAKENRGLITGSLSLLNENYIYPIINSKVVFIDDFPAPLPEGKDKHIYQEFHRDIPSFYRDIWWPDMLKSAAKYKVKYTGLVIQTYNNQVTPPFKKKEHDENTFVQFGRELLNMGGEIGIHGYNHQSLTVNPKAVADLEYNAWKNQDNMEIALNITENYLNKLFPNYHLYTYVPPSNRIDSVGEAAVHQALPTIQVLSSLYLPDDSEYSTVHEFERGNDFLHFPRVTSGYEYTKNRKWVMANAITSLGVFSHFIHPDDVLDIERSSGKGWTELYKEYDAILHDINTDYPWLQTMTASKAGKQLSSYLDAAVYINEQPDRMTINIDRFPGKMEFMLRTEKKIGKLKNCLVQKADTNVYYVEVNKATAEIRLVE
ncbi:DUF2194 domain-containing protein [Bacillus rubiinfantis]|uniref:DUF2194 domain-containing protein n=1 Tax=Bacillus rubiinfantis TaxID=1499680 RepID=UPI000693822F|nr:DUF2194 domain-containing protein [Bacillus rubiinfantis]